MCFLLNSSQVTVAPSVSLDGPRNQREKMSCWIPFKKVQAFEFSRTSVASEKTK